MKLYLVIFVVLAALAAITFAAPETFCHTCQPGYVRIGSYQCVPNLVSEFYATQGRLTRHDTDTMEHTAEVSPAWAEHRRVLVAAIGGDDLSRPALVQSVVRSKMEIFIKYAHESEKPEGQAHQSVPKPLQLLKARINSGDHQKSDEKTMKLDEVPEKQFNLDPKTKLIKKE